MNEENVKVNSLKAWILASRPKTLTGAAVPVMIGTALAIDRDGTGVRTMPAVLCFVFAFLMQIAANFVNDYFDFLNGTDNEERLGPKRACSQGWISPDAMKKGIVAITLLSCLVGFPLVLFGGWNMIIVGAACVLFCFLYTTCLSYIGCGDLLVLLFFGIVPVCTTFYLVTPDYISAIPSTVVWISVACGLAIDTLLVVNNYRDIDNDRHAGKNTLVVMIGRAWSRRLYFLLGVCACLLTMYAVGIHDNVFSFVMLLYLPFHVLTYKKMVEIDRGAELNKILGSTARNIFIYGLLTVIAVVMPLA